MDSLRVAVRQSEFNLGDEESVTLVEVVPRDDGAEEDEDWTIGGASEGRGRPGALDVRAARRDEG